MNSNDNKDPSEDQLLQGCQSGSCDFSQESNDEHDPCRELDCAEEVTQALLQTAEGSRKSSKEEHQDSTSEGGKRVGNPALTQFLQELQQQPDAEAKLRLTITFMQGSISQSGNPQFKNFWEARKHCLDLFKENITPASRVQWWAKYRELSDEAHRLKEILDEQAAFACEQIDGAIKALETDIEQTKEQLIKMGEVSFPQPSKVLEPKLEEYLMRQKELNLLNAFASKVNSLRKELIKTDMRISHKNKFFKRLSIAGDRIFPRRKELIKEISHLFIEDVESFIQSSQSDEEISHALFFYREEIKALQGVAKVLTLNTHAFTSTRAKLSECWDRIKRLEKDRKKEQSQKKIVFKENADRLQIAVADLSNSFSSGQVSINDAQKQLDEIYREMRQVELGRQEVAALREALNGARKNILDKVKEKENERHQEEAAREKNYRSKIQSLKDTITSMVKNSAQENADQLTSQRDSINEELSKLKLSKSEKMEFDRLLKPLKDIIADKKEKNLLTLSPDDRQAIDQLREVLKQRKQRQKEIKEQLEQLRKAGGSSGLDFEQAMSYTQQVSEEKERLEKANLGLQEVERKIAELERKK